MLFCFMLIVDQLMWLSKQQRRHCEGVGRARVMAARGNPILEEETFGVIHELYPLVSTRLLRLTAYATVLRRQARNDDHVH
jgi:hypothetical protein